MLTHFYLKILVVLLAALLLVVLRVWLQAEAQLRWYQQQYFKKPRVPNTYPKLKSLRAFMLSLFNQTLPGT
jgi:hypothetical protein